MNCITESKWLPCFLKQRCARFQRQLYSRLIFWWRSYKRQRQSATDLRVTVGILSKTWKTVNPACATAHRCSFNSYNYNHSQIDISVSVWQPASRRSRFSLISEKPNVHYNQLTLLSAEQHYLPTNWNFAYSSQHQWTPWPRYFRKCVCVPVLGGSCCGDSVMYAKLRSRVSAVESQ